MSSSAYAKSLLSGDFSLEGVLTISNKTIFPFTCNIEIKCGNEGEKTVSISNNYIDVCPLTDDRQLFIFKIIA